MSCLYIVRRLRNTAEATAADAVDAEVLVLVVIAVVIKGGVCRRIRSNTLVADDGPAWIDKTKAEMKDEAVKAISANQVVPVLRQAPCWKPGGLTRQPVRLLST